MLLKACNNYARQEDLKYCDINEELLSLIFIKCILTRNKEDYNLRQEKKSSCVESYKNLIIIV